MMRRFLTALGTTALLAAALTGCTQLVPDSGAPTAGPSGMAAPEPSLQPNDALKSDEPTPTPFTTYPARPTSKAKMQSLAAELKAGRHPLEQAVPGSERVVLSKRFVGPHEFAVPATKSGATLAWSVSCLGGGQIEVEISGAGPFTIGGTLGCSPSRAGGRSDALPGPGTVRIHADRYAEVQLDLVAFDVLPLIEDEAELIASLGRMDGVDPDSVMHLASATFTGTDQLVLPKPRTGTHLVVLLSCPQFTQVALQLADADGPIPATEYLGSCLSGDASGTADWADPDPARELTLTAAPYAGTGTTMRLQVFGYATDGSDD